MRRTMILAAAAVVLLFGPGANADAQTEQEQQEQTLIRLFRDGHLTNDEFLSLMQTASGMKPAVDASPQTTWINPFTGDEHDPEPPEPPVLESRDIPVGDPSGVVFVPPPSGVTRQIQIPSVEGWVPAPAPVHDVDEEHEHPVSEIADAQEAQQETWLEAERRRLRTIPDYDDEIAMLQSAEGDLQQIRSGYLPSDNPISVRARQAGEFVVERWPLAMKGYDYRFHVQQSVNLNAFAIATGEIGVTSALMELLNDRELVAVLAHEVAHVEWQHTYISYGMTNGASCQMEMRRPSFTASRPAGPSLGRVSARRVPRSPKRLKTQGLPLLRRASNWHRPYLHLFEETLYISSRRLPPRSFVYSIGVPSASSPTNRRVAPLRSLMAKYWQPSSPWITSNRTLPPRSFVRSIGVPSSASPNQPVVIHELERIGPDRIGHSGRLSLPSRGRGPVSAGVRPILAGARLVADAPEIVLGASGRVVQYIEGVVDFRHARSGFGGRVAVGMVKTREPVVGNLNDLRVGGRMDLQDFVEVGCWFRHWRFRESA